ncbi:MAG: carboxylating nicotinate-nucleotide diphosphorylase [Thermodesulfobacteriota bacterium]
MALFDTFFTPARRTFLWHSLELAFAEDGRDLTSEAVFGPEETTQAEIVAKEQGILAGIPLIEMVLHYTAPAEVPTWDITILQPEGAWLSPGQTVARLTGQTRHLLRTERVILNFICHLCGIATVTNRYVQQLGASHTQLLDTRKTLPGLRFLEKYAVRIGGGVNHRMDLEEMLMLKDNHIDSAGGIPNAVRKIRARYTPCPPIEVECRSLAEVHEAVAAQVDRIMLDNMPLPELQKALQHIPAGIESELSGGVEESTIAALATCGADFISVGRLTHSAPALDLSMRFSPVPGNAR